MSDPILKMEGIYKSYNSGRANEVPVLRNCDLTLNAGQVVSLVAPSGAGKSTLYPLYKHANSGRLQMLVKI